MSSTLTQQPRPARDPVADNGKATDTVLSIFGRLASSFPWLDRKGRLSPLRGTVFALLWVPVLVYAGRYALRDLGPRPLHELLLAAGTWTIWWLLASLAVTPLKAVLGLPGIVVVRRMIGLAAFFYAVLHLMLYAADENWLLLHVAAEIARRFYLSIGFVALAGLTVLGWTSRDAWVRQLGPGWKRLHKLTYAIAALGVFHYYLQSKADASAAVLASGVFAWLMLWRLLPAGRDRSLAGLAALAVLAGLTTTALEFAWYGLATRVDPWRVLHGELDITFGLRPAAEVTALGILLAATFELSRLSLTRRAGGLWGACSSTRLAGLSASWRRWRLAGGMGWISKPRWACPSQLPASACPACWAHCFGSATRRTTLFRPA